jgi:hypothetical protein
MKNDDKISLYRKSQMDIWFAELDINWTIISFFRNLKNLFRR